MLDRTNCFFSARSSVLLRMRPRIADSNRVVQAIFFYDTNTLNTKISSPFTNTAYFSDSEIAVQWKWLSTNLPSL